MELVAGRKQSQPQPRATSAASAKEGTTIMDVTRKADLKKSSRPMIGPRACVPGIQNEWDTLLKEPGYGASPKS